VLPGRHLDVLVLQHRQRAIWRRVECGMIKST
jgi:hypothetical protein